MATLHTDMPADTYHADPWDQPSLSSSVARALFHQTPAHARASHPRLTDTPVERHSHAMDNGTALHQLLLGEDRIDVLDYPDWRTNAAKEAREEARASGRVPMLAHQWQHLSDTAERIRENVAAMDVHPRPFTAGKREQTVTWLEDTVRCRARIDWLRDDMTVIDDLKTTSKTAAPRRWAAGLFRDGHDMQAAFYTRAIERLTGTPPVFRFVVAETDPPYAVSVIQLSEQAMFAAQVKVDTALSVWRQCLETGEWPAYEQEVYVAEIPGWLRPETDDWSAFRVEEPAPF